MNLPRLRAGVNVGLIAAATTLLAACGSMNLGNFGGFGGSSEPPVTSDQGGGPEVPATIRAEELVGRWGLASFHKPDDQRRTEAAAKNQCKQPYVINSGPTGGVIMHLADEAQPQELRIKGSQNGKNYIGPAGPPGGGQDREIVSFDGRVMITRFIDPDAAARYGTMVYVRCGARA
jgi:hypothetical protein